MGSELNKALAAFQADMPSIPKAATADTGVYKFDYAPLEDITDKAMPLLGKNGLAWTCLPGTDDESRLVLDYALLHESGEEKAGRFPLWLVLPEKFKAQTLGGLITFFRRYCLCAVTGIAPGGDDNDAATSTEVDLDRVRPAARTTPRPPTDVPPRPVVPGPRPGPGHEQLRSGTVEWVPEDKPTGHGPLPDDANPWQAEPPEHQPGSYDPKDVTAIQAAYSKLGFDTRTDRAQLHKISGQLLQPPRTIGSHKDLSNVEARQLRATLAGFKGDRGALMEQLTGIRRAVAATTAQDAAEGAQEEGVTVPGDH